MTLKEISLNDGNMRYLKKEKDTLIFGCSHWTSNKNHKDGSFSQIFTPLVITFSSITKLDFFVGINSKNLETINVTLKDTQKNPLLLNAFETFPNMRKVIGPQKESANIEDFLKKIFYEQKKTYVPIGIFHTIYNEEESNFYIEFYDCSSFEVKFGNYTITTEPSQV